MLKIARALLLIAFALSFAGMCAAGPREALAPPVTAAGEAKQKPELFSAVMQRVSAQPEYREKVLAGIREVPKFGEFLSPDLVERLRVLILGKEWQRVDHFPALTIAALNKSVEAVTAVAGKPATPPKAADLLDTAEFPLDAPVTIDLDAPATHPTYAEDPATAQRAIGFDLTMGDGPNPELAPMHAQSRQLAAALNRLAMNGPERPEAVALLSGRRFTSADAVIAELIRTGHQVRLTDDVYFANFGHLHDRGREVIMPFWIDTQIAVPASGRALLVPVSHSEQELHIRGPRWNVDVSFYFGIDGKAEFRTMDSLDQSWVLHRVLHVYERTDQQEHVLRLLSAAVRVYHRIRLAHPEIPFGGYYRLGVCQDVSAAVEYELTGATELFPITHDPQLFPRTAQDDPRDAEFLAAFAAIPSDRSSGLGPSVPPVERVLGGLPTTHYGEIEIPGLAPDLRRVQYARNLGLLRRTHPLFTLLSILTGLLVLGLIARHQRQARRSASAPAS